MNLKFSVRRNEKAVNVQMFVHGVDWHGINLLFDEVCTHQNSNGIAIRGVLPYAWLWMWLQGTACGLYLCFKH